MRVRITRVLHGRADGFDLSRLQKGQLYDVGTTLGNLLLAEGWAVPADLSEPAMVIPLSRLNAQTVLIVDDDSDVRALLHHVLGFAGFVVVEASNGRDALAALIQHRPAVIILDLRMPEMDGWQFREAQRRLPDRELADVPILVLTGVEHARDLAKNLGAAGIFEKPFDPDRLLAAVHARVR